MRWVVALVGLLAASFVALCLGTAPGVGPAEVFAALTGGETSTLVDDVVFTSRLPQVLLGLLVGASLSVSGVLFQALLRNELAEPYLLGVGPGALAGITAAALLLGDVDAPQYLIRGVAAFVGAVAVAVVVFSFARRGGRRPAVTVLLAGIAVGAFVHAIATGALHTLEDWHLVMRWLLGDLSLAEYSQVAVLGVVLAVGGAIAWVRGPDLDVLTLGEEAAWYTGVEVRRAFWVLGGVGCFLAAGAVAQCGLVGFVGLVVPHIGRRLFGPGHRGLIPASALIGAGLLVMADALSRTLYPPQGFPLAVVTAALGAPVLAWLVLRRVGS